MSGPQPVHVFELVNRIATYSVRLTPNERRLFVRWSLEAHRDMFEKLPDRKATPDQLIKSSEELILVLAEGPQK